MLFRLIGYFTLLTILSLGTQSLAAWQDKTEKSQEKGSSSQEEKAETQDSDDDSAKEEEKDEEPTAKDIMKDAIAKARGGDLDGAITLIEKAKALDPENPQYALNLIGANQSRAMQLVEEENRKDANPYFFRAAALVRELNRDAAKMIGPRAGSVIYNEACSYAVDNNKEKALASLDEAFERGYDDIESTRADVDFESIRESKEFVALLAKHEKRLYEEMLAKTKSELEEFKTYDFDFTLKNLDGDEIKLEDYKGKIVIVDFWGTWCGPCVAEIPHFIKLKESYGEQGLEIVGLAYERAEDTEEAIEAALEGVKDFVAENKMNYVCAIGDEETQKLVPDFEAYPTTLFIDREGVVRLQLVGYHPHAKLEMVIQQLLGAKEE